ncbi:MAG: HD domain-containing protein [Fuerstia sp.]|nr:HD domain-containing protein [Fuerstiella sp.]
MYSRNQTEYYRAKLKAAKRLCKGWVKPAELPTNAEIRDEIQRMANLFEGSSRFDRLREMRVEALRVMRLLARYRPKIIGSTFTGHIRHGSDIDIHVFAASTEPIESCLDAEGFDYRVERKVVRKHGEEFQLAALLHDVGKGLDADDHVGSGLEALEGHITPRTAWLIEHHMEAHQIRDRTIGFRAHQRLKASPEYETLLLLSECDRNGRVPGAKVPELDDVFDSLRDLEKY